MFFRWDVRFNESEVAFKESIVEFEVDDSPCVGDVADVDGGDNDAQPFLRRSVRARHRPDYYAEGAYIAAGGLKEPTLPGSNSNSQLCKQRCHLNTTMFQSWWSCQKIVVICSKWVYKMKMDHVERYKARWYKTWWLC